MLGCVSTGNASVCVYFAVPDWSRIFTFFRQPKSSWLKMRENIFSVVSIGIWGAKFCTTNYKWKGSRNCLWKAGNSDWLDVRTALNPILMKRIDAMRLLDTNFEIYFFRCGKRGQNGQWLLAGYYVLFNVWFGNLHSSRILFYAVQNK